MQYLTTQEAAQAADVESAKILAAIQCGSLAATKINGEILVTPEALREWSENPIGDVIGRNPNSLEHLAGETADKFVELEKRVAALERRIDVLNTNTTTAQSGGADGTPKTTEPTDKSKAKK